MYPLMIKYSSFIKISTNKLIIIITIIKSAFSNEIIFINFSRLFIFKKNNKIIMKNLFSFFEFYYY